MTSSRAYRWGGVTVATAAACDRGKRLRRGVSSGDDFEKQYPHGTVNYRGLPDRKDRQYLHCADARWGTGRGIISTNTVI
jgi:hypothetical protein